MEAEAEAMRARLDEYEQRTINRIEAQLAAMPDEDKDRAVKWKAKLSIDDWASYVEELADKQRTTQSQADNQAPPAGRQVDRGAMKQGLQLSQQAQEILGTMYRDNDVDVTKILSRVTEVDEHTGQRVDKFRPHIQDFFKNTQKYTPKNLSHEEAMKRARR